MMPRTPRLFRRRVVLFPTAFGAVCLALIPVALALLWWLKAEAFLCQTHRLPAEVLVVEAWIGYDGIRAAAEEFHHGNYKWVVATGGLTGERWSVRRFSYAQMAEYELLRDGVPRDRIIRVPVVSAEIQRTYHSAKAVQHILQEKGLAAGNVNVFTMGAHARRSRLIFARVLRPLTEVGVIAWKPPASETGLGGSPAIERWN